MLDNRYIIASNSESGEGKCDIALCPKDGKMPGIIIELKADKGADTAALKELANIALKQITDKEYDTEMQAKGVKKIIKYGIAFSGKHVEIVCR